MKWKVAEEFKGSRGLEWIRRELEAYDWSQCEWITFRRDAWGHKVSTYPFEDHLGAANKASGLCQYPTRTRSGLDRITCKVNRRLGWPVPQYQRVSPLYRNEDGTWPEVPDDHFLGEWFISADGSREWMRTVCRLWLKTKDEGLVYIIAHKAFHYLRRTKQIEGKNVAIDADTYAEEMLGGFREYQDGS